MQASPPSTTDNSYLQEPNGDKASPSVSNTEEPTTTYIFRPISFDDNSEEMESSGSSVIDSAYGSDITQGNKKTNGVEATKNKVTATVQNKSLWKTFSKLGNEMIVTKPGRRLFPALMVSIHGLDQEKDYSITLRVASADNQRYRYINLKWVPTGESEVIQNEERQIFHHPSSPNSGQFWMKRPVSFKTIKITHYPKSKNGNILLHTMHKYFMEIIVTPVDGSPVIALPLDDTTFIAVSAYQNMELTQTKIDNNPFAKGFRYKMRSPTSTSSTSNGTTSAATTALQSPVTTNTTYTTPDRSVMAYWQHMHNLGLAATQRMSPAFLQPISPNTTSSQITHINQVTCTSPTCTTCTPTATPMPLAANGVPTHFPVFYPQFVQPYPIPTTNDGTNGAAAVSNPSVSMNGAE